MSLSPRVCEPGTGECLSGVSKGFVGLRKQRHGTTSQIQRSPSFLPPPAHPRANPATQLSADLRGRAKCQKFPQNTEGGGFLVFLCGLPGSTGLIKLRQNAPPTTQTRGAGLPSALGLREGKWEEGATPLCKPRLWRERKMGVSFFL